MCLNIPDLEVLLSETERGVPKFLRGGGTMYNIAVLEANQNQAALLKALIEKNVHKEVLNVITCLLYTSRTKPAYRVKSQLARQKSCMKEQKPTCSQKAYAWAANTKKPAHLCRLNSLVASTGFEPAISALRGRRPKPLDDEAIDA